MGDTRWLLLYHSLRYGILIRTVTLDNLSVFKANDEPRHEKTNILVSDLVRHKLCTATENG